MQTLQARCIRLVIACQIFPRVVKIFNCTYASFEKIKQYSHTCLHLPHKKRRKITQSDAHLNTTSSPEWVRHVIVPVSTIVLTRDVPLGKHFISRTVQRVIKQNKKKVQCAKAALFNPLLLPPPYSRLLSFVQNPATFSYAEKEKEERIQSGR